jgi:adenylyl-sulfate kinase
MRWLAGGPDAKPAISRRRLWFAAGGRQVRVEFLRGQGVGRTAVKDGTAWWRWDENDGETAGDLAMGGSLPPLLDPPILAPASFLQTMWFGELTAGTRLGRDVLIADATPRDRSEGAQRHLRFEFDSEYGTPLFVATFDDGECVSRTETLRVTHLSEPLPGLFSFARRREGLVDVATLAASPPRHAEQRRTGGSAKTQRKTVLRSHKTIWLTGIPGAGKTTVARATERLLNQLGIPCCVLDGDELRSGLSSDLGLSRADRSEQARRVAHVAITLASSGVVPIVALVSPYAEDRDEARRLHRSHEVGFLEVWMDTPVEICAHRDPKGLYRAAAESPDSTLIDRDGDGSGLTGLTAPYEAPTGAELRLSGHEHPPRVSAMRILEQLLSDSAGSHVVMLAGS